MQKKDDKVDNKIPYKRERERKQRERERKIEIDSQVQIVACVHVRKTKELFYPGCHGGVSGCVSLRRHPADTEDSRREKTPPVPGVK